MTSVSIKWSSQRIGNSGFVLEEYSDGTERKFGPMPAHSVPSFISARRRLFALRMERRGHAYAKPLGAKSDD